MISSVFSERTAAPTPIESGASRLLTIAIPTFDRNDALRRTFARLLPQLTDECEVLVLDNASPTPAAAVLSELLDGTEYRVDVVRNRTNIGANANILRCFELCSTRWVWILGDDDDIRTDAVSTIINNLHAHPDTVFFNYFLDKIGGRTKPVQTRGLEEFVSAMETYGDTIFISTNVYNVAAVLPQLKFGYHYAYSAAPQFAILIGAVGTEGICWLRDERIVKHVPAGVDQQWSRISFALGYPTLLEMPLPVGVRWTLAKKFVVFNDQYATLRVVAHQLMLLATTTADSATALFLYDALCYRRYYFDRRIRRRLQIRFYRLLLRFPGYGLALVAYISKRYVGSAVGAMPESMTARL